MSTKRVAVLPNLKPGAEGRGPFAHYLVRCRFSRDAFDIDACSGARDQRLPDGSSVNERS